MADSSYSVVDDRDENDDGEDHHIIMYDNVSSYHHNV